LTDPSFLPWEASRATPTQTPAANWVSPTKATVPAELVSLRRILSPTAKVLGRGVDEDSLELATESDLRRDN
jgi:hypothetical protein